eukprot:TRINITY_DN2976_c0_g1_i1.p1 TRINITY_DN2976_c0_g1~~TRINITY_DN2976_c0_g1_i1.p1  ORF type:complete len:224 (-),score=76.12 TRINITY_DN2976_c0_g1_i1:159-794(-)
MGDEDRQIKYINVGMEFTTKVTRKILDNLEGGERDEQLDIMRNIMTDYIKMENEYNISKKVLAKLKKGLEAENADMNKDVEAEYRAKLQEEMESTGANEEDHQGDSRYQQLEAIISGSSTHGDDDLMVTDDSETFIDPWSRKPIVSDPITNRKCKHTYEKATVMKFLEKYTKSKKALKCPVVGCGNNSITKADLYTDTEIRKKIARQNRGR